MSRLFLPAPHTPPLSIASSLSSWLTLFLSECHLLWACYCVVWVLCVFDVIYVFVVVVLVRVRIAVVIAGLYAVIAVRLPTLSICTNTERNPTVYVNGSSFSESSSWWWPCRVAGTARSSPKRQEPKACITTPKTAPFSSAASQQLVFSVCDSTSYLLASRALTTVLAQRNSKTLEAVSSRFTAHAERTIRMVAGRERVIFSLQWVLHSAVCAFSYRC